MLTHPFVIYLYLCVNAITLTYLCNTLQTLISFDQYNNLILQDAVERRIVTTRKDPTATNAPMSPSCYYTDIPLGMYIVRGDSMVLTGALGDMPSSAVMMKEVSLEELEDLAHAQDPLTWEFDLDLIA
jgi:small nuclear ribonucleoprotein (snRNP)-like protein